MMKVTLRILWSISWIAVSFIGLQAQAEISEIRFMASSVEVDQMSCFDIQLKSGPSQSLKLASQNYRFYYDASHMRFLRHEVSNLLDNASYGPVRVLQAVHNSNASGYGNLEFGSTLGFVNLGINDNGNYHTLTSMPSRTWISTARVCFEILNPEGSFNMVWGREGVTEGYATAFTTISVTEGEYSRNALIEVFEDLQEVDTELKYRMADSGTKN